MIQISKSVTVPAELAGKGVTETIANCKEYDADPEGYNSGKKKFTIQSGIYGAKKVKAQLIQDQHKKCCFCEADFTANGYGDVEHFRPKAGYTQERGSRKLQKPGYYWLAYTWQNLFFSCQICNQRHKKNYFPLQDPTKRAQNHQAHLANEKPVLLHPQEDNPENHLKFNRHVVVGLDNRGEESINAFGLDRTELNELRGRHLKNVELNLILAKVDIQKITPETKEELSQTFCIPWTILEDVIKTAKLFVANAAKVHAPFAAMVRSNFPGLPT